MTEMLFWEFSTDLDICAGRVGYHEMMSPGGIFGLVLGVE